MTKTVTVPMGLGNPDDPEADPVYLEPGDELPSWAEDHVDPQYVEDSGQTAGGTNLYSDHVYQVVKGVADERGVDYGENWSADQIAAAVRLQEVNTEREIMFGDDDEEVQDAIEDSKSALDELFSTTNEAGNMHAPDVDHPSSKRKTSKPAPSAPSGSGAADS